MRCEDYPCCGHTDGLPCDWTYTPEAQAFDSLHFGCEHEAGYCEAYDYDEDEEDLCDECSVREHDMCGGVDGCPCCSAGNGDAYVMEDQWLDGSYEE